MNTSLKILFYDTKSYDRDSFQETLSDFPEIEIEYTTSDFDALCRFQQCGSGNCKKI